MESISRETVLLQLEADMTFRRRKMCPLVDLTWAVERRRTMYPDTKKYEVSPLCFSGVPGMGIFPSERWITKLSRMRAVRTGITRNFSMVEQLLGKFPGELILAGGCLARSIQSQHGMFHSGTSDADFFFIGCSKERIVRLLDEVENLFHQETSDAGSQAYKRIASLRTTTFVVTGSTGKMSSGQAKYQFVHSRSYPSPEAVVLGFDIPAASVFYDGHRILMTPMAAFTLATNVIFIDPSRRSTTYEKRLRKYTDIGFALGTIATSVEDIRVAYAGTRQLGSRILEHELVPGIKVTIDGANRTKLVGGMWRNVEKNDMFGDYGSEAVNEYMLAMHNAFFAMRGLLEQITWTKTKPDQPFKKPKLLFPKLLIDPNRNPHDYSSRLMSTDLVIGPLISREEAEAIIGLISGLHIERENVDKLAEHLATRAKANLELVVPRLAANDFEYIGPDENPGRQHTSSFNPVYGDVRDYWFYRFYHVTEIGLPHETYHVLRSVLRQNNIHEKGVLKIICNHLMLLRAHDALQW